MRYFLERGEVEVLVGPEQAWLVWGLSVGWCHEVWHPVQVKVATLKEGAIFGEMAMFAGVRRLVSQRPGRCLPEPLKEKSLAPLRWAHSPSELLPSGLAGSRARLPPNFAPIVSPAGIVCSELKQVLRLPSHPPPSQEPRWIISSRVEEESPPPPLHCSHEAFHRILQKFPKDRFQLKRFRNRRNV